MHTEQNTNERQGSARAAVRVGAPTQDLNQLSRLAPRVEGASVFFTPEQAHAAWGKGQSKFVDVRGDSHYERGHIPSAVSDGQKAFTTLFGQVPVATVVPERYEEMLNRYFRDLGVSGDEEFLVFYGESEQGDFGAPCRAAILAMLAGIASEKIRVLEGGYNAWRTKFPIDSDIPETSPSGFQSTLNLSFIASAEDLRDALVTGSSWVLDVRSLDERVGAAPAPYIPAIPTRTGSLLGSIFIDYTAFIDEDEGFRTADDVRQLLNQNGIALDTPGIVTCYKGSRASAVALLLLEAGFTDVKVSLGSWHEASRFEGMPRTVVNDPFIAT